MPPPAKPAPPRRKYFSVVDANKALPLVRAIVGDIVQQFRVVNELEQRLVAVLGDRKRKADDIYSEELAHSQAEKETEEEKLKSYIRELNALGVELKGAEDGLCDFPSLMDGREVFLCWRLGESEVAHWHEIHAGFAGRKPLATPAASRAGGRGH